MGKYDHIIDMERPMDLDHEPMSLHNRAAQFAPFDALTGFGGRIWESSRITEDRIELDEEQKLCISKQLHILMEHVKESPKATFTYFIPDKTKDGGAYVKETHRVKRIDEYEERVQFENESRITFDDILIIEGELFSVPIT